MARVPDLDPGAGADHGAVAGQPGVLAQHRRDGDPALPVGHLVAGAGQEHAQVVAGGLVGHRRGAQLLGQPGELVHREDEERVLLPAGDDQPVGELVRNRAGRNSRPFSSNRGEWVPRNTAPTSPLRSIPNGSGAPPLPVAPPYSTSPHRQGSFGPFCRRHCSASRQVRAGGARVEEPPTRASLDRPSASRAAASRRTARQAGDRGAANAARRVERSGERGDGPFGPTAMRGVPHNGQIKVSNGRRRPAPRRTV